MNIITKASTTATSMASEVTGDGSDENVPSLDGDAGFTSTETVNIHIHLPTIKNTILAASLFKLGT
jgi:hypothetical protein